MTRAHQVVAWTVGLGLGLAALGCESAHSSTGTGGTGTSSTSATTSSATGTTTASTSTGSTQPGLQWFPGNYVLFVGTPSAEATALASFLASPVAADFDGVQLTYAWTDFEGGEGDYSAGLTALDMELQAVAAAQKKLILQVEYKQFGPMAHAVPAYMRGPGPWCATAQDCGEYQTPNATMPMVWQGLGTGGTADRLQAWLTAMAAHVASSPERMTVAGFVLPETAVGQGTVSYATVGYTPASYLTALEGNATALLNAAPGIPIFQYINQFSASPPSAAASDLTYLKSYAEWARAHPPVGIGCPDVVPGTWGAGYTVPVGYQVLLDEGYQGVLPYNVSIQKSDYLAPRTTGIDASYGLATQPATNGMAAPFVNWQDPTPAGAVFALSDVGPYVKAHPDPNTAQPTY